MEKERKMKDSARHNRKSSRLLPKLMERRKDVRFGRLSPCGAAHLSAAATGRASSSPCTPSRVQPGEKKGQMGGIQTSDCFAFFNVFDGCENDDRSGKNSATSKLLSRLKKKKKKKKQQQQQTDNYRKTKFYSSILSNILAQEKIPIVLRIRKP